MSTVTSSVDRWMEELYPVIKDCHITEIAIPGTHDSGSYNLRYLHHDVEPEFLAEKWGNTQNRTMKQQLEDGIRYFDLRVYAGYSDYYIVHTAGEYYKTFWGETVDQVLAQYKEFISKRSKEIIVLSFNHFYGMNKEYHEEVVGKIKDAFGSLLVNHEDSHHTIGEMIEKKQQVIVLYGGDQNGSRGIDEALYKQYPFLWPLSELKEMWADTRNDKAKVFNKSIQYLSKHPSNKFLCLFGTFTAQFDKGLFFDNIQEMAKVISPLYTGWVDTVFRKYPSLNVVCLDYYNMTNLVQVCIDINRNRNTPIEGNPLEYGQVLYLKNQKKEYLTTSVLAPNLVAPPNQYYPRLSDNSNIKILITLESKENKQAICVGDVVRIRTLEGEVGDYHHVGAFSTKDLYYYKGDYNQLNWVIMKPGATNGDPILTGDGVYFVNCHYQGQWMTPDGMYLTSAENAYFFWTLEMGVKVSNTVHLGESFSMMSVDQHFITEMASEYLPLTVCNQYFPKLNGRKGKPIQLKFERNGENREIKHGDTLKIVTTETSVGEYKYLGAWSTPSLYYYKDGYSEQEWEIQKLYRYNSDQIKYGELVLLFNKKYQQYLTPYGEYLTTKAAKYPWVLIR